MVAVKIHLQLNGFPVQNNKLSRQISNVRHFRDVNLEGLFKVNRLSDHPLSSLISSKLKKKIQVLY